MLDSLISVHVIDARALPVRENAETKVFANFEE